MAITTVTNPLVFLVYFVDEGKPNRDKTLLCHSTDSNKIKANLENLIFRGAVQYGEQFSAKKQVREFREDWRKHKNKTPMNAKLRYASLSAVNPKFLDSRRPALPDLDEHDGEFLIAIE